MCLSVANIRSLHLVFAWRRLHRQISSFKERKKSVRSPCSLCECVLPLYVCTRQAMYVQRNTEARSCNHCCSGNSISSTYSECVFVALSIQPETGMRHIVIFGLPRSTIFFSTLSHKRHDFLKKKKLLNTKCVFSLQFLSETFLILRTIHRDIVINVYWSSRKVPLILSDFNENWIFSTDSWKIPLFQNWWKSGHWELTCSMRTDGQTDRHYKVNSSLQVFERA